MYFNCENILLACHLICTYIYCTYIYIHVYISLPSDLYICQLAIWLKDILDNLCHQKLKDVTDFEWQRYIKPYLSSTVAESDGKEGEVVLCCLDQHLSYGYEYTGCTALPVFTPRSENYLIGLTQVLAGCKCKTSLNVG